MEFQKAHVHYCQYHAGLIQFHLVFKIDYYQGVVRYMRLARALGLDLIQVTSASGVVTSKELIANYNQYEDKVVVVGFISDCVDAKQITFNLPPLNGVWNTHKGERVIVYNNNSMTLIDWGRARPQVSSLRGDKANVTMLTIAQAENMVSQPTKKGKWFPENVVASGVRFSVPVFRSLDEQIGVEALMSLPTVVC